MNLSWLLSLAFILHLFNADCLNVYAFSVGHDNIFTRFHPQKHGRSSRPYLTELALFRKVLHRFRNKPSESSPGVGDVSSLPRKRRLSDRLKLSWFSRRIIGEAHENVTTCIIGGGVSGLVAATEVVKVLGGSNGIVLVESSNSFGGRVQSDKTEDGFTLDRGFAVYIEEYPVARNVVDYGLLKLNRFQPGALVKIKGRKKLSRVSDPFRNQEELLDGLFAPVGSLLDKLALIPLLLHAQSHTIEDLFMEKETDSLTALTKRWKFSNTIIDNFFAPFLEGIFLAPLKEQSSRMFMFVFKMISQGFASLPEGGIGAVSNQLVEKAQRAGVSLRAESMVQSLLQQGDEYVVSFIDGRRPIRAKSVIVATDGQAAQRLLSGIEGFQSLANIIEQPQRAVGCLYYSFEGDAPVKQPVLILSGMGDERSSEAFPVNNVCFPSVVCKAYAPEGETLCSVTVLSKAMDIYQDRHDELDLSVRRQLATWFPGLAKDIMEKWVLKKIYDIKNAQPSQLSGPFPANVNGGRDCDTFRSKKLPPGLFMCGDHMATASLNGALESGLKAGKAAALHVSKFQSA